MTRPVKTRQGSRVIVMASGRVLLMSDHDPGVPGFGWWVVPGGGLDEGETWRQAAVRELFEETGIDVDEDAMQGPVAKRLVKHGYSDRILIQAERFFVVHLPETLTCRPAAWTEREKRTLGEWGWFTPEQMASMRVWPEHLAAAIAEGQLDAGHCVDWGEVEESAVPIDHDGHTP